MEVAVHFFISFFVNLIILTIKIKFASFTPAISSYFDNIWRVKKLRNNNNNNNNNNKGTC